ncbi:MAG: hypothetical protein KBS35_00275 [Mycoplasma sp.]|nr:hypothetical protein [Candidatus Hennigella equi]
MKRKFILFPITLTVLAPTIVLIGCGKKPEPQPEPEPSYQPFETCDWTYLNEKCVALENGDISETEFCNSLTINGEIPLMMSKFIGAERQVIINNQKHIVKVVGTSSDDATHYQVNMFGDNKKAALTFEFSNLISDANGKSLACQWNDTEKEEKDNSNLDYTTASIQQNLNGEGDECAVWFEKNNPTPFKGKSVFSMLPRDLQNAVKMTKHYVATTTTSWSSGVTTDTEYFSKVFLPTHKEIYPRITSDDVKETLTKGYKYYSEITITNADRIKTQVVRDSDQKITEGTNIITKYKDTIYSYAGFDDELNNHGGYSWLSSPSTQSTSTAWEVVRSGAHGGFSVVYMGANSLAPCFCL